MRNSSIPWSVCILYAIPCVTTNWLFVPMSLIQGIYGKYYDISLESIAIAILFAKIFDTITDPVIGYFSDRYYQNKFTRKPFIAVGSLLCVLSGYFLFVPTDLLTLQPIQSVSLVYFICWSTIFFLAWTIFEIPHLAWANDLARTSGDKARIFSVRAASVYIGIILFYSIAELPIFVSSDITPEVLRISAIIAGLLMAVFVGFCLWLTPSHYGASSTGLEVNHRINRYYLNEPSFYNSLACIADFLKPVLRNGPLKVFLAAYFCKGISVGMFYGLFFIYVDSYLEMGDVFSRTMTLGLVVALATIPLWRILSGCMDKNLVWMISISLTLIAFSFVAFFEPEKTSVIHMIIVVALMNTAAACTWNIAYSILSEIIDYSAWKYNIDRTAQFFSVFVLVGKLSPALAMSLGLMIVALSGFDFSSNSHTDDSIAGLKAVMIWILIE